MKFHETKNWDEPDKNLKRVSIKDVQRETTRSSGPGGQNVNKVETAVRLTFVISTSGLFSEEEKDKLLKVFGEEITVKASDTRSQKQNEGLALLRLNQKIEEALIQIKERKRVGVPKKEKERRLGEKKHQSEKKKLRKDNQSGW